MQWTEFTTTRDASGCVRELEGENTQQRGRAEGREHGLPLQGLCYVSLCLTPEFGDVSATANTHTDTHTPPCCLPNFTQLRKREAENRMMKHYLYCCVS